MRTALWWAWVLWTLVSTQSVMGLIPMPTVNASAFRIAVNSYEFGFTSDAAYRATIAKWQPTIDYINAFGIGGNRTAEIVPVYLGSSFLDRSYDLYPFLASNPGVIDAVLTDALNVECLETLYGARSIAGWVPTVLGVPVRTYRPTMLAPMNSTLNRIDDIRGRKLLFSFNLLSTLDMQSLFTEMNSRGAYVFNDAQMIMFANTGNFIPFLINGYLETTWSNYPGILSYNLYATTPLLIGKNIRIVEQTLNADFPFPASGSFSYPSWSMVFLGNTTTNAQDRILKRLSTALLEMPANTPATTIALYDSWTSAYDYKNVRQFMTAQGALKDGKCNIGNPKDVF